MALPRSDETRRSTSWRGGWWPSSLGTRVLLLTSAIAVAGIVAVTVLSARAAQQSVDRRFDVNAQNAQTIAGTVLSAVPIGTASSSATIVGPLDDPADFTTPVDVVMAPDAATTSDGDSVLTATLTAGDLRDRFSAFVLDAPPVVVYEFVGSPTDVAMTSGEFVTLESGRPPEGPLPWELAVDDRGAVYIGLDDRLAATLTDDGSSLLSDVNRNLLITALTAIGMTVGVSFVASRTVTRPVLELTGAARRLEDGDLTQRVTTSGRGEVGELAAAFNSMADTMERQEELRQSLVRDVAHELRTPIQNLVGQLDAVADNLLEPDEATLGSMRDDALLLARLVTDLNELAQVEAGQLPLHRAPFDLVATLDGVVRSALPRAEAAGISIALEADTETLEFMADRERIAQVAHNLLDNALTNTPAGGTVVLHIGAAAGSTSSETRGGAVRFEVRDTGRGIAPEHLPHLFNRFYRVDPSRSRATGGAGLGLAIVHRLVRAHGGTVAVSSTEGKGSTFTVVLPRNADHTA